MNKYSVVRVTVISIEDHCPFYKVGDSFVIKQQCFDPKFADPEQFCMQSLNDIYNTYSKVRNSPIGSKLKARCIDEGKVTFDIERINDEQGKGWL